MMDRFLQEVTDEAHFQVVCVEWFISPRTASIVPGGAGTGEEVHLIRAGSASISND
jgi:hypothetical protein